MPELNLVLLGPPGSGKGTQGERLNEDLRLPYYATGDILRAAVRDETELGKSAKAYMDRGDLVPDEVIVGVIADRIDSEEARDGFILDGFPRTTPQAEALDVKLGELGRAVTTVLLIDVPDGAGARRQPRCARPGGRPGPVARRLRRRGRAPPRRPPHLRGRGPRLPRRVQPAEGRGGLRHRRLAAGGARRRQARRDPQAARHLSREDRAARLPLRGPPRTAEGRRRARARRGHRGAA